jgi:phage shock protein A
MQARAGAMEELMATGALETTGGKDSLTVELERLAADSQVENELAAMRAQLGGAQPPAAVAGAAAETLAVGAAPADEVVDAIIAEEPAAPAAPPAPPAPPAAPAGPAAQ